MKKSFKVIIIVIVVIILVAGGILIATDGLRSYRLNYERINNSKTLSQYIENHDFIHLTYANDKKGAEYYLEFYAKGIKCDVINNKNILYYNGSIMVLEDYTVYETAFTSDKTYSNKEHCKKIDVDFKIERIKIDYYGLYFISDDNKFYRYDIMKKEFEEINDVGVLITNVSIKERISRYMETENDNDYIVLKNDGQVYVQEYEKNELVNEYILLSNKEYGNIKYVYYDGTNDKITRIVSDKGLFYLKVMEEEYIDSEPIYKMVLSDIYRKYEKDIEYINEDYVFTNDNNIIETEMLCVDIDKEVK